MGDAALPIEDVTTADLIAALEKVLRKGLPVSESEAGNLSQLRSVYARAVVPSDPRSRLTALNELLPRLVAGMGDSRYRESVQILLGLAPGTRGANLTSRRRQAASLMGYNTDHFRTRVEDDLVRAVAGVITDDLLRYRTRVKRSAESLEPTGDTPRLGPEHINHEEELISRIWQYVYGVRAEIIAYLRACNVEGDQAVAEEHAQALTRNQEQLAVLLKEYEDTYKEALLRHGEAEYSRDSLERLTHWRIH